MNAAYLFRLMCLSLASFFLVNGIAGAATALFSSPAIRFAETMRPRSAARFLFFLRMFSSILGMTIVLVLCVPSYLWLEPQIASERVGLACLLLAGLALLACFRCLMRTARAFRESARLWSEWWHSGNSVPLAEIESPGVAGEVATVVEKNEPLLALTGLFRPHMVISRGVLAELPKEQLYVAVRHEVAHRNSRDNLKRLFLALSPEFFPFANGFAALEKAWARFSEWAADDEAVQGNAQRALSLATALLRVARMGTRPRLSVLHSPFVAGENDLSARVERLLHLEPRGTESRSKRAHIALAICSGLGVCVLVAAAGPEVLSSIHSLLELFLR